MLPYLLHLGFPRTATTTMQASLERNSGNALFLGRGPAVMERRHDRWRSGTVTGAMSALLDPAADHVLAAEALHREAVTTAQQQGSSWAIISDERICKPPPHAAPEWRSLLAARAATMFPGAHVLLTVRRQDVLLKSLYGRYLQLRDSAGGPPLPFGAWLDAGGGSDYASWQDRFDFHAFYEACAAGLGRDRVHVAAYEQFIRAPDALPSVFRRVCPESTTRVDFSERLNSGWMPRGGQRLVSKVWDVLGRKHAQPFRPTIEEADLLRIRTRFADGNSLLCRATGLELPDYGAA